jgi:hypothetical protein
VIRRPAANSSQQQLASAIGPRRRRNVLLRLFAAAMVAGSAVARHQREWSDVVVMKGVLPAQAKWTARRQPKRLAS